PLPAAAELPDLPARAHPARRAGGFSRLPAAGRDRGRALPQAPLRLGGQSLPGADLAARQGRPRRRAGGRDLLPRSAGAPAGPRLLRRRPGRLALGSGQPRRVRGGGVRRLLHRPARRHRAALRRARPPLRDAGGGPHDPAPGDGGAGPPDRPVADGGSPLRGGAPAVRPRRELRAGPHPAGRPDRCRADRACRLPRRAGRAAGPAPPARRAPAGEPDRRPGASGAPGRRPRRRPYRRAPRAPAELPARAAGAGPLGAARRAAPERQRQGRPQGSAAPRQGALRSRDRRPLDGSGKRDREDPRRHHRRGARGLPPRAARQLLRPRRQLRPHRARPQRAARRARLARDPDRRHVQPPQRQPARPPSRAALPRGGSRGRQRARSGRRAERAVARGQGLAPPAAGKTPGRGRFVGTMHELTGSEVAVIGMALRFPGARTPEELWENLKNGVESIRPFADEELIAAGHDPAHLAHPAYVKARPAIDGIELFDADLFGIPAREARLIDPQHRLFLECCWEALERAGCDSETYPGSIGVYAGSDLNSYLFRLASAPGLVDEVGPFQVEVASDKEYLASRVSYKLDLRGPSLAVQTACSTSLVAIHLACQGLLSGECDMALAGGASVLVPQTSGYFALEGGIHSRDGHCRSFDARAQGTVFGSGVGT